MRRSSVGMRNVSRSFPENCVGNTNAFKYVRPRARPGSFNGAANIKFCKVPIFECSSTYDLNCAGFSRRIIAAFSYSVDVLG